MARGALVRLQARDGSRTSGNEPSLACRASASITGCVRKFLLRLRPSAYLTRDHRLVAATTLRLKTKMQAAKTSTVSPRVAPSGAGARRVSFRSICARRCPIGSLNLIRDKIAVWLISAWQFCYNMTQSRCKQGKRRKTTKWAIKRAMPKGCLPVWSNGWWEPFGLSPNMHWRQ